MSKKRDELIRSLGGKPSVLSEKDAYEQKLIEGLEGKGDLPEAVLNAMEKIKDQADQNN